MQNAKPMKHILHRPLLRGIAVAAMTTASFYALAQSDPVETAAIAFTSSDGFESQNIDRVVDALDGLFKGDNDMLRGDADVSAVEKALLLLDAEEVPFLACGTCCVTGPTHRPARRPKLTSPCWTRPASSMGCSCR